MVFSSSPFVSATGLTTSHVLYSEVRIEGLETTDYLDNLSDRKRFTEQGAVTFESQVYGLICGFHGFLLQFAQ